MSLTIALIGTDGLILAADSRTTEGYTLAGPKIRDDSVKFIQLNESWGVLTYGLSDIGQAGITTLREKVLNGPDQVSIASVLEESTQIFSRVSSDWSRNNPEIIRRDKDVGFMIGGYDRMERGVKVFNFQSPDFLSNKLNGRCLLGGQWQISKYLVKKFFTEDVGIDTLKALAVFLLDATMTVEKTVGGAIRLAIVTESKGFEWVQDEEMRRLLESNRTLRRSLQEHFYTSLMSVENNH